MKLLKEEICDLLRLIGEYDLGYYLLWDEELDFEIMCNDFFFWGCSDGEPISSSDDMVLLRKSIEDMGEKDYATGALLYCARKREVRPQGACYTTIPENYWHLFNECGPHREACLGNPEPTPELPV